LPAGGCASANFETASNGRISGKVTDSQGDVVPLATVDLVPEDTDGKSDREIMLMSFRARTDKEGRYQFQEIPPGRFILGINLREEPRGEFPYPRTYYPGTAARSGSIPLVLDDGQELTGIDLPLPPSLSVRTIEGIFVWSDGSPVTRGHVYLKATKATKVHGRIYASATVDGQGRFSLRGFDGVRCWLHGSTYSTAGGRMQFIDIDPVEVLLVDGIEPQKLVAPVPKVNTEPKQLNKP
jgi:hypothetical protein